MHGARFEALAKGVATLERDGGEREPPDPGCRCPSTWGVRLFDL